MSEPTTGLETNVNPLGMILGGAGSVLNAFATFYAVGEQRKENKATRTLQDKWFQQNFGLEQQQQAFTEEMGRESLKLNKRQLKTAERLGSRQQRLAESTAKTSAKLAGRQMAVTESQSAADIELGGRGMAVQEKTAAADIALGERGMALQEKTAKFNQVATVLTNMTRFFNSPANNMQYVSLWRK